MAKAAISAHQNKAKEKKNAELKLPFIGIGIFGENIMLFWTLRKFQYHQTLAYFQFLSRKFSTS